MIRVIALKKHVYKSRPRLPGEIYEAAPKDLVLLTKIGFARLAETPESSATAPKRRYKRRDMVAEDT